MRRALRLRRASDIARARAGRSWANPYLVLCVAPAQHELTRVAVTAGRRIGSAVIRNRVRRRVRESVRHRYERLARGKDLIFIARAPSATADWPSLDGATFDLLRRSGMIPDRPRPERSDA